MECPICSEKVSFMKSIPVNSGHGGIERICFDCMKKLGIGKMNILAQESIKTMASSELKEIVESGKTLKEARKENEKSLQSDLTDFLMNGKKIGDVFVSDKRQQLLIIESMANSEYKIYDFEDIESYDREVHTITNTTTKKKHGITRGVVGGVIAGPVGALIGAGTSGSNSVSKENVSSVDFEIHTKGHGTFKINLSGKNVNVANDLDVFLNSIAKVDEPTENKSSNNLDDLTKLKELLDAGILTEEEFTAKKKQILGI